MINIIICEDNKKDRNNIEETVKRFMESNKKEYTIYSFDDYNKKFEMVEKSKIPFKIYLLDIETPTRSGIDVAREIRRKDIDSIIMFITAHEELGNLVLKDDLLFLSFINKFDDFENRLNCSLKKSLILLNQKNVIRFIDRNIEYTININDILYITTDSVERKTIIKTDYAEFKISKSLGQVMDMLDERFIQTHRACYVNKDRKIKVDKSNKEITFDDGETIDLLSDKYKREVSS